MKDKHILREADIQAAIIKAHRASGWLVIKLLQTTMNGIPDLLLIKEGRAVFVEVKTKTHPKPSPLQTYVHTQLRKAGVDVFVANTTDFLL